MPITLYYISGSDFVTIDKGNNDLSTIYGTTNLITCGSLSQIFIFSGSSVIANFPSNDTIVYYNNLTSSSSIFTPPITTGSAPANLTFNYSYSASLKELIYIVSSSTYNITGSESSSFTTFVDPNINYMFKLTGSDITNNNSQIVILDNSIPSYIPGLPGTIIKNITGSNIPISASVYLSSSHNYTAYLYVSE